MSLFETALCVHNEILKSVIDVLCFSVLIDEFRSCIRYHLLQV